MKQARARSCLVTAVCLLLLTGTARADAAGEPREYALGLLAAQPLQRSISAWGLDVDDIARDIESMSGAEVARLADSLARLETTADPRRTARSRAMYLALISQMREARLFASILSRTL